MIKGIIFDMDGVLVHTDKYHYLAWKSIADKLNIPFNEEINNLLRGVSRMESLEIILKNSSQKFSDMEKLQIANEKNEIYVSYLQKMNQNDVSITTIDLLNKLKKQNIKLAIGSSSKNATFIAKQVKIFSLFDAISDGNNISYSKPNPEVFIKAAEMLNLPSSECLVVEDAISGIEAAKNGGFIACGIHDATNSPKCDYKITDISQLLDIINGGKT